MKFLKFSNTNAVFLSLMFFLTSTSLFAQTRTVVSAGNWNSAAIWQGGTATNIADQIAENVSFTNNLGGTATVTVPSPQNYTVGNVSMNQGNKLTIAQGATLNVGNSTNSRNLTPGNNNTLTVSGTLIVWGNLNPGGNFILNVTATGVLIVKGNMPLGNDTDFNAFGSVDIDGSFSMGGNADLIIRGPFDVGTTFTLGNDANLTVNSPADVNVGGNFVMGGNADFIIDSGADFDIGGSFTVPNDANITVNGGLGVVGNFDAGGNLDLTVGSNGDLDIGGNLKFANDADVIVNGDMDVTGGIQGGGNTDITVNNGGDLNVGQSVLFTGNDGNVVVNSGGSLDITQNFTAGGNTDFIVGGAITIGNNVTVGNGSTATGSGSALVGGTCSDGTSNFCGQGPFAVMPIKLAYFNAVLNEEQDQTIISWATEKEESFDYFEIEYAGSDLQFSKLTSVQGSGANTQSLKKYSWVHTNPIIGDNYYRLKAVDIDGSFEYFDIKHVTVETPKELSIYPNPSVDGRVSYKINFEPVSGSRVIIVNGLGNELKGVEVSSTEGELTFSQPLQSGIYYVQYVSNQFTKTLRLVVR